MVKQKGQITSIMSLKSVQTSFEKSVQKTFCSGVLGMLNFLASRKKRFSSVFLGMLNFTAFCKKRSVWLFLS